LSTPEALARFHDELPLVDVVARQIRSELDHDEMMSFGREGLLEAAQRFDPDRGVPFRRFANYRVRGAILDGMRSHAGLSRRTYEKVRALESALLVTQGLQEDTRAAVVAGLQGARADDRLADTLATIATAMAVGFGPSNAVSQSGEVVPVSELDDPERAAESSELMALVRAQLETLPESEACLIRRHYLRGEDIDDVSKDLGLSKSWGSRLLSRGMATLTKKLQVAAR
jgi:RNA polymerase sigma factor for flagellar operon FliA